MAGGFQGVQGRAPSSGALLSAAGQGSDRGQSYSKDAASQREQNAGGVSVEGTNMTAQLPLAFPRRRPQVPYWHTTPLTPEQLAGAMRVAEQQDELVLAIFRAHREPLSPSQVWEVGKGYGKAWLLTSVRRSITNLADPKCGVLVRLNATRMGPHGRPEHCWALQAQARAA